MISVMAFISRAFILRQNIIFQDFFQVDRGKQLRIKSRKKMYVLLNKAQKKKSEASYISIYIFLSKQK